MSRRHQRWAARKFAAGLAEGNVADDSLVDGGGDGCRTRGWRSASGSSAVALGGVRAVVVRHNSINARSLAFRWFAQRRWN
jgi:hypothetical protein